MPNIMGFNVPAGSVYGKYGHSAKRNSSRNSGGETRSTVGTDTSAIVAALKSNPELQNSVLIKLLGTSYRETAAGFKLSNMATAVGTVGDVTKYATITLSDGSTGYFAVGTSIS